MPSFQEIKEAHNRIKQFINQTPIMTSRTLNKRTKGSIYLKCENFQRVGAFKFRGAVNTLLQLSPYEKEKGITDKTMSEELERIVYEIEHNVEIPTTLKPAIE